MYMREIRTRKIERASEREPVPRAAKFDVDRSRKL